MSTDLVTWLRAQLDADKRMFAALGEAALNGIDSTAGWDAREYVERIPGEVDAKRRILRAWENADEIAKEPHSDLVVATRYGIEIALRALALPYADRPGYDESWRP